MTLPQPALMLRTALAVAVLAAWMVPAGAWAQELTGVALGPDEAPLAGVPVVLHRVGGGGGAFISTDTTDAEGGFRFELEPAGADVYFAALRYEGSMYIGPAVEAGGEPVTGYILRVEPGSEAGAVASALAQPGPMPAAAQPAQAAGGGGESDLWAFFLVGLLAVGAAAAFLFAAPRYRHRRTRDALVQLATVENALAGPDADADRARLEATRDRLRKQLAPRS
jgi:hypothetical protein